MIPALIAVGILSLFAGTYLGMAGMALLAANRHALMRQVITRQAHELLEVRADAARYKRATLLAEHHLPVQTVADILRRESVRP